MINLSLALLLAAMLAEPGATEAASAGDGGQTTMSVAATKRCLVRQATGGKQAPFSFVAIVPDDTVGELTARGFAATPCTATAEQFAAYKAQMCKLAEGNDAVQARTEEVLGTTGIKLCNAARKLVGEPASDAPPSTSAASAGN